MQPILTAEQMREVDRVTIEERGLPGLILMENAGSRVYELLAHRYAPLHRQRIVVLCGKGNNGGDGLVVARHLLTRGRPASLRVILLCDPNQTRRRRGRQLPHAARGGWRGDGGSRSGKLAARRAACWGRPRWSSTRCSEPACREPPAAAISK